MNRGQKWLQKSFGVPRAGSRASTYPWPGKGWPTVLNITFKRAISLKILNLRGKRVFQGHQCGPESRIFGRGKWRRRRWRSVGWPLAGTEGTAASTHSGAARATILGIIGRRVPPNHLLSSLASKYPAAARPIDNEAHTHSLSQSIYLSTRVVYVRAACGASGWCGG